jgi:hypothetical protein
MIDVTSVVITTSNLPIIFEITPSSIQIQNQLTNSITSNQFNNSQSIITDFIPLTGIDTQGTSRFRVEYAPTSQYRYFQINSTQPLYNMDFNIYWTDKFGNQYPVVLSAFQVVTIKIVFIKKEIVSSQKDIKL